MCGTSGPLDGGSDLRCQNAYTRLLLSKPWHLLHGYSARAGGSLSSHGYRYS